MPKDSLKRFVDLAHWGQLKSIKTLHWEMSSMWDPGHIVRFGPKILEMVQQCYPAAIAAPSGQAPKLTCSRCKQEGRPAEGH
jgi:hypothetical protein